ncbi:hypothetical protein B0H13DRAFT_2001339, partial [Mycena leptocephala]
MRRRVRRRRPHGRIVHPDISVQHVKRLLCEALKASRRVFVPQKLDMRKAARLSSRPCRNAYRLEGPKGLELFAELRLLSAKGDVAGEEDAAGGVGVASAASGGGGSAVEVFGDGVVEADGAAENLEARLDAAVGSLLLGEGYVAKAATGAIGIYDQTHALKLAKLRHGVPDVALRGVKGDIAYKQLPARRVVGERGLFIGHVGWAYLDTSVVDSARN